jgi:hypothetical protein
MQQTPPSSDTPHRSKAAKRPSDRGKRAGGALADGAAPATTRTADQQFVCLLIFPGGYKAAYGNVKFGEWDLAMTDTEGAENTELTGTAENTEVNAQSESDESESDEATGGTNEEHAEELASADYQQRMEEFDNVESSVPVTTVPATGESGTVEMPKSE